MSKSTTEEDELARLCHDIRQYVAAGQLVARMPADEYLSKEVQQRLATIEQMFGHISQLLDAGANRTETPQSLLDLVELVDDCVKIVQLTHDVSVVKDLAAPAFAFGDPVMLRRAVANVLDNATRAAGQDGSVSVHVGEHAGQGVVEVADDGLGFGRIPSVSGHGMSIVDAAVRACHGSLAITSGPGPGTTVRLSIPVQHETGAES